MGQRWHSCKIPACFNSQAPMEGCMRKGNCAKSPCEYTKLKKKQSPFVCIKTMKNIPDYFKLKLTCSLLSKVEKGTVERSLLHTRPQRSPYSHPMLEPAFFFQFVQSISCWLQSCSSTGCCPKCGAGHVVQVDDLRRLVAHLFQNVY